MFAPCNEPERNEKHNNASEADPPGEFHHWQPVRLVIKFGAEYSCDRVWQSADQANDDESRDHGDEVSVIVAAGFGQHTSEENAEDRAISVAVNSEHNRNNAHVWINNNEVRGGRGDADHEDGEPDRSPAHGA